MSVTFMLATSEFIGNLLTALTTGSVAPGAEGLIGSLTDVISGS